MNIIMFQDSEREFVVTHNANIKPVSYFTGRETELQELRQRIEEGRNSILVSGMAGIGKTQICRKLFEEYLVQHVANGNGSFQHIGYVEYNGDMGNSLQKCLKYKQQDSPEKNQEAAWRELEFLASDGKLLLFIDNVDKSVSEDISLQRLNAIPCTIILISRQVSFGDVFEPYRIGFLDIKQCIEIYERIRFGGSGKKISTEEISDLEYIIEKLTERHTFTVEFLAHRARNSNWSVKMLEEKLCKKALLMQLDNYEYLHFNQKFYELLYVTKTVFLSHNIQDREAADRIDKQFREYRGITVKRDERDIGVWKSIHEFMKSIRDQDYAVLIVSDSFLKSSNCMFEVMEIMKEQDYEKRIFPTVEEYSIYDPLGRAKYIMYWQRKCEKLETAIRKLDPVGTAGLVEDLKRYKSIVFSIGEFLSIVADRKNPNINEVVKEVIKAIYKDG